MVVNCCVKSCKSFWFPNTALSFYRFPRNENLQKWLDIVPPKSKIGKHSHICSNHFNESDFQYTEWRRILKKTAVPSIFDYCDIKRTLPTISAVPAESAKDEFIIPDKNVDEELKKQFEFVSCDSVSANQTQFKVVPNINSEIKNSQNFDGVKEEKFDDNITIKDEIIEFEDGADQEINTNINIKDESGGSLISSENQQAQEMLQDNITIKEELIEFEDNVDKKICQHDSVLNFSTKDEADDSSVLSEKQQVEEIVVDCYLPEFVSIKEEPIDTVD